MATPTSQAISAAFPFQKKKVNVLGSDMAFVDVGTARKTATVFLHGNPTSSYLWRNIIPHVSDKTRCIAPDLIGFGDSDKVLDLAYRVSDHQRYLDAFMDLVLPNEKIVLVIHDWGSALGLDWARRHEDRVAGIALMEFLAPTDSWSEFKPFFVEMFSQFRNPQVGRKLLIDQNLFVERVLQSSVVRSLTDEEMTEYRRPFLKPEWREPVYRFPNELPIAGQPPETWEKAQKYMTFLFQSDLPKLFFWVNPGTFVGETRANMFQDKLHNTRTVYLGKGSHYIQEDYPHEIGRELADWLPPAREGSL